MSKFLEYIITEATSDNDQIRDIIPKIKNGSAQWLKLVKNCSNKTLWRGVTDSKGNIIKKSVRTDRRALSMRDETHKKFDAAFKKHWGWPARTSGLFAVGEKYASEMFGDQVFTIFPVGAFKFVWSKEIMDLIDRRSATDKQIDEIVKKEFTDKDLCKALASGNEIMIKTGSYYGITDFAIKRFLKSEGVKTGGNTVKYFIEEYLL